MLICNYTCMKIELGFRGEGGNKEKPERNSPWNNDEKQQQTQ